MSCCNNECDQGRCCPAQCDGPTWCDGLYVIGISAILAICSYLLGGLWSSL